MSSNTTFRRLDTTPTTDEIQVKDMLPDKPFCLKNDPSAVYARLTREEEGRLGTYGTTRECVYVIRLSHKGMEVVVIDLRQVVELVKLDATAVKL